MLIEGTVFCNALLVCQWIIVHVSIIIHDRVFMEMILQSSKVKSLVPSFEIKMIE